MNKKINQSQKGYVTVVVLLFIIALTVAMSFLIETARLIHADALADRGVDLAVRAGAEAYSNTFTKELEKAYIDAKKELDEKIAESGEVLTEEEYKERIKKIVKEDKIVSVKNESRNSCKSKAEEILKANTVEKEIISCTDSTVTVTGKYLYKRFMNNTTLKPESVIKRTYSQQISINLN